MADYLDQLIKKAKESKKAEKPSVEELRSKLLEKKMDKALDKPVSKEGAAKAEENIQKASGQPQIQLSKSTQVGVKQEEEKPEPERKSAVELDLEAQKKIELASYGDVKVYKVEGKPLLYYYTPVIKPSGGEKNVINTIKEAATRIISIAPYKIRDPEQRRNAYKQRILEILNASKELNIPERRYEFYAEAVVREMVGYGIIDSLIRDDKLEEIMVIGAKKPVYVFHREYEMMATNIEFFTESEIIDLINRIGREIGRRIDISSPLLDARLPDGSRVNATIPPASPSGASLTIRKFREDPYSIVDLINFGTIDVNAAAFLWLCVEGMGTKPASILISGGTGSGKTTLLNVLASFISPTERIVVIEDTSELNLPLTHLISMEARPPGLEGTGELTMDILTKNALRMRPDRIIVGEVRHAEAFTLFTALNTGHEGCLTGETKIALTNGLTQIDEFVEEQISKNKSWDEKEWKVCEVKNEFINSLDENGKIFKSEIVEARKKPFNGRVYHIKLASGTEITCTGNHPFYELKENMQQINAEQLQEGQRIAAPRKLLREEKIAEKENEYWSGLLHGDGSILDKQRIRTKNGKQYICNEGRISLYMDDKTIIPKFANFMQEKLEGTYVKTVLPRPNKQCYEAHVSGYQKSKTIQKLLDIPAGNRAKTKMSNSHFTSNLKEFVAGFFDAEGFVDTENNAIVISNGNENYIDFFKQALLTEGILSRKYESNTYNSRWFRLYIYGINQVKKFCEIYPIKHSTKIKKIKELLKQNKKANTNINTIECNELIIELLKKANEKGYSDTKIAKKAGITQGLLGFYKRKERTPSVDVAKKLAQVFEQIEIDAAKLKLLAEADIFWDKIIAIHSYDYNGFVYDLTTNETIRTGKNPHNFVAEGIIVGNSMGTIHANSPAETIVRITSPPMSVPEVMISGLDFIVIEHRLHDKKKGTIRRVTEISEVSGTLEGKTQTNDLFEWDALSDKLVFNQNFTSRYLKELQKFTGMNKKQIDDEISERAELLRMLVKKGIRSLPQVSQIIQQYITEKRGQ